MMKNHCCNMMLQPLLEEYRKRGMGNHNHLHWPHLKCHHGVGVWEKTEANIFVWSLSHQCSHLLQCGRDRETCPPEEPQFSLHARCANMVHWPSSWQTNSLRQWMEWLRLPFTEGCVLNWFPWFSSPPPQPSVLHLPLPLCVPCFYRIGGGGGWEAAVMKEAFLRQRNSPHK